jgi:hypothetical protein
MIDYSINVVEIATLLCGLFTSFLLSYKKFIKIELQLEQLIDALDRLSKLEMEITDRSARLEIIEKKLFNGGYRHERSS